MSKFGPNHADYHDGGGGGPGGSGASANAGAAGSVACKYWAECSNRPRLPASLDVGTAGGVPLVGRASQRRYGRGCAFGSLPGYWDQEPAVGTGNRWRLLDAGCQPQNRLHRHMKQEKKCPDGPLERPRVLLLLGDSVDRTLIEAMCRYTTAELSYVELRIEFGDWASPIVAVAESGSAVTSTTPNQVRCGGVRLIQPSCGDALLATIHLFGVSLAPPWHLGVNETYEQILTRAVAMDWRGGLHLPDPDLVVLNSNMWDIARLLQLANAGTSGAFHEPLLPESVIGAWADDVRAYVVFLRTLFPDTVLAWHTISIGKVAASGAMEHLTLGKKSFIVQLNAAGRALAAELGLLLVDYEAVTLGFHDSRYLMDSHHPTDKVSLEVMNLYLALLAQLPDVPLPHPGQCAGVRGLAAPADGVPTLL